MKSIIKGVITTAMFSATLSYGQLQFTRGTATEEGAIKLYWQSETNTVYEIQYADNLYDPNLGGINWQRLFTDYPSHGTNTFIGDFGNYDLSPPIPHPKYTGTRFYRVVNLGTNDGVNPTIAISSPVSGAVLSGTITISIATTSQTDIVKRSLYVDGQEMNPSPDGTNWVINTCEWQNGPHTLFAVAKSSFGFEGIPESPTPVTYGRAVSPYVNVTFSNLITRFAFSEFYFEPSLAQTQEVSAVFAANVNWTLHVLNASGNSVRTATGSGATMLFPWDGKSDGGASLPVGFYNYSLTAQTNGLAIPQSNPPPSTNPPPPAPGAVSSAEIGSPETGGWYPHTPMEAMMAGLTTYYSMFPPLPPQKTPQGWIIHEPEIRAVEVSEAQEESFLQSVSASLTMPQNGFSPLGCGGPSSQTAVAPTRPPTTPGQGTVGTCGYGYQTYPNGMSCPAIVRIPGLQSYIAVDGRPATSNPERFGKLSEASDICSAFAKAMRNGRYAATVTKTDDGFTPADLTGGAFNQVNVGVMVVHCSYATTSEVSDSIRHVYMRFLNNGVQNNVKLDQCNFGGAGTNGLKWMAMLACNVMHDGNYDDLLVTGRLPVNNDLHLLLGASTFVTAAPNVGSLWAQNMLPNGTNAPAFTVEQAWYQAGKTAYVAETDYPTLLMNFRVCGWPGAFTDKITDVGTNPGAGMDRIDLIENTVKVHPLP